MTAIWMSAQARRRLEVEMVELMSHRDFDATSEDYDDQVVAAWLARKARIREIHNLLTDAVVGQDPPDDGVAEPGMVLTIRYDDTDDVETFLLGVRGAEDIDVEVYSLKSPLGSALAGARPGEQRSYPRPNGSSQPVTLLSAVPFATHLLQQARA